MSLPRCNLITFPVGATPDHPDFRLLIETGTDANVCHFIIRKPTQLSIEEWNEFFAANDATLQLQAVAGTYVCIRKSKACNQFTFSNPSMSFTAPIDPYLGPTLEKTIREIYNSN